MIEVSKIDKELAEYFKTLDHNRALSGTNKVLDFKNPNGYPLLRGGSR
jgi:hypothetical protein